MTEIRYDVTKGPVDGGPETEPSAPGYGQEPDFEAMRKSAGAAGYDDAELDQAFAGVRGRIAAVSGEAVQSDVDEFNELLRERITRRDLAYKAGLADLQAGYSGLEYGSDEYNAQEEAYDAFHASHEDEVRAFGLELNAYERAGLVSPGTGVMADNVTGYGAAAGAMDGDGLSDAERRLRDGAMAAVGADSGVRKGPYGGPDVADRLLRDQTRDARNDLDGLQALQEDLFRLRAIRYSGEMDALDEKSRKQILDGLKSRVEGTLSDVPGRDAMVRSGSEPWLAGDVHDSAGQSLDIAATLDGGTDVVFERLRDSVLLNRSLAVRDGSLHELHMQEAEPRAAGPGQESVPKTADRQLPSGAPAMPSGAQPGMEFSGGR